MSEKVTERHLQRKAVLYVRQSTMQQVRNNEESRLLQYSMRDRLKSLGWKKVEVIDEDLGRSAGGMVDRVGFQRLVTQVTVGAVGVVAARELSRFARNSRDWQRLLEVCRYVDTLLVDQDAVYDVRQSNDRLLLGLKGSLNEYELDLLRLRALEAKKAQASRGEYFARISVGYRKNDDGQLEKTPDLRVQQAITLTIEKSLELGSARQCLMWLRENGIQVPINRNHRGEVAWRSPHYGWVYTILTNPIYAGAYTWGRTVSKPVMQGGETRMRIHRRRREDWGVLIQDHHEAYMRWEQFERLQEMLAKNAQKRRATKPGAAKKGPALLAGLLRCRRCGQKLMVQYTGGDRTIQRYACSRRKGSHGDALCISFGGRDAEERVAELVLEVVQPAGVEAALRAAEEQDAADGALEALRLQLEARRYAADRAARQYDAVDPANRLVADELERRWNAALEDLAQIETRIAEAEARSRARSAVPSSDVFKTLGADLERIWNDPATDVRLKKRVVRALVEEIIVDADEAEITMVIHWKGGIHTELRVPRRRRGQSPTATPSDIVDAIRQLARICDDTMIAKWLSREGLLTGKGNPWTRALVASLRHSRGIPTFSPAVCEEEGWLPLSRAAVLVGVAEVTLKRAIERGVVEAAHPLSTGPWILRREELLSPEVRANILKRPGPGRQDPSVHPSDQLTLGIPRR